MPKAFKKDEAVRWKSHGGNAHGKVVTTMRRPTRIGHHKVAASPGNPEVIVETKDGKLAAHHPSALIKE